jgi:hypothetical protein
VTPLHQVVDKIEAAANAPLDAPAVTARIDAAEIRAYLANAERALGLLERLERLQQDEMRFAAYVSDSVRRKHAYIAAKESRLAGFAANSATADT